MGFLQRDDGVKPLHVVIMGFCQVGHTFFTKKT